MAAAIETQDLTKSKSRKPINVVDRLNLHVEEGEIFGFLGPNGAGKTTTIKMLLSIIYPTTGEGYVLGKEIGDMDVHKIISYVPERPYYYEYMTGLELLKFYGSLFGLSDEKMMRRLMEEVGLGEAQDKTISQYSKGMQQRIGLAQSRLNGPKLVFLDEPTGGLDPIAHLEIRDQIVKLKEEGKTVFISSHELSEVELICDRVAIINHGQVVAQGPLGDLLRGGRVEISATGVTESYLGNRLPADAKVGHIANGIAIDISETEDMNGIIDAIRASGGTIVSMIPRKTRLEDLFREAIQGSGGGTGHILPSEIEGSNKAAMAVGEVN
ncbi:MAG: hypothetical protein C4320_01715 [Armatimonadota bacterium]